MRVLLIEDNPEHVELFRSILQTSGFPFDVDVADRLSEGLARLADGGIDLVLLDLTLPDSAGFETFARVRTHAPNVPVVIFTNRADEEMALRAVREARRADVPTIGLSNEPASELARSVDVYLPTQTVERPEGSFSITPRICQLAVLDQLVTQLKRRSAK